MALSKRTMINKSKNRGAWLLVKYIYNRANASWQLAEAKSYYMKSCTAKHSPYPEGPVIYYNDLSNKAYAEHARIVKRRNSLMCSKYLRGL